MAEPPPASAFGRIPAIVEAAISPDGKHVAMLGGASDQRIVSIATIDQPGLPVLPLGDVEAVSVRWADSGHLITRFANWYDAGPRHAYRIERNVVVDLDAHLGPILLRHDVASSLLLEQPVLGLTPASPPRAIMLGLAESTAADNDLGTLIHRKGSGEGVTLGLFSVDLASGKGELLERGSPDTGSWEVDAQGRPRVRLDVDAKDHGMTVLARAKDRNQYTALWSTDLEGRRGYFGYSAPDDAIYLGQDGGIVRKRLADGAVEPVNHQPVEGSPRVLWDDRREAAVGVESGAEKPVIEWFDPEIGAVHATLTRALKGQAVEISSWSDDRTRFVVRASAPGSPGVWYLFDKTRKEVSPLGEEYPELKGAALGTTKWITYKARDGLPIPAYLTLPPAGAAGAKPPLVVLPHGGPAARDDYDFDFLA
jgi:hypothetical protein